MTMRQAIEHLEKRLSRRVFFATAVKGAGVGFVLERFGDRLFGADAPKTDPRAVLSAIGNIVIPLDEDPGWITFEPDISAYALNVVVKQVLLAGDELAFAGVLGTLGALNDLPPVVNFGIRPFLEMSEAAQADYFGAILTGQFEKDGVQDLLFLPAFVALFSTKATFFSNFPNHLAKPGAEFQDRTPLKVKTGWDIMGYKGPISAKEEKELRDKYFNVEVLPGMDPKNPYI